MSASPVREEGDGDRTRTVRGLAIDLDSIDGGVGFVFAVRAAVLLPIALAAGCSRVNETSFQLPNGLQAQVIAASKGDRVGVALVFGAGQDADPPRRSGLVPLALRLFRGSS